MVHGSYFWAVEVGGREGYTSYFIHTVLPDYFYSEYCINFGISKS